MKYGALKPLKKLITQQRRQKENGLQPLFTTEAHKIFILALNFAFFSQKTGHILLFKLEIPM